MRWEGCRTFESCLTTARLYPSDAAPNLLAYLEEARVIKASAEEANRLWNLAAETYSNEEAFSAVLAYQSPFPSTFFEFVNQPDDDLWAVLVRQNQWFIATGTSGTGVIDAVGTVKESGFDLQVLHDFEVVKDIPYDDPMEWWAESVRQAWWRVLGLQLLLEATNVSLSEEPVSRQVRRKARREGSEIPLTIRVKRGSSSSARGGTVDYSHQWDVMGHFRYTTRGSKFDNCPPEKLVRHPDEDVLAVKEWVNPYVKGPSDKPYIPKVRLVGGNEEAAA